MMGREGRRYRVMEAIGRGGFGTVYRARLEGEAGFTKLVALKVLNADHATIGEVARRMRDEARILGLVRHRALVSVDGLVKLSGRWAVVMELVDGVDFGMVHAAGRMPACCALEACAEVAGALHAAWVVTSPDGLPLHMIHRDVKPSNILITGFGETKLLDFGAARADFSQREAHTRSLAFGSLGYMAPERFEFIDGPEVDVYALGIVLYELVTGLAWKTTPVHVARHRTAQQRAQAAVQAATGSVELAALVGEALDYQPERRPTAEQLEERARDLAAALRTESLRTWAARVVPPLLAVRPPLDAAQEDLSGSLLFEWSDTPIRKEEPPPVPPQTAPPPVMSLDGAEGAGRPAVGEPEGRSSHPGWSGVKQGPTSYDPAEEDDLVLEPQARGRGLLPALLGGLVLALAVLVAVVGVGAVVISALLPGGRDEVPTLAEVVAPDPSMDATAVPVELEPLYPPLPAPEDATPLETTSAKPPATGQLTAPAAGSRPMVSPPDPAPRVTTGAAGVAQRWTGTSATAKSPPSGHVSLAGDIHAVRLRGPGGICHVGSVAPGEYVIEADFGHGYVPAGRLSVASGEEAVITCAQAMTFCRASSSSRP